MWCSPRLRLAALAEAAVGPRRIAIFARSVRNESGQWRRSFWRGRSVPQKKKATALSYTITDAKRTVSRLVARNRADVAANAARAARLRRRQTNELRDTGYTLLPRKIHRARGRRRYKARTISVTA